MLALTSAALPAPGSILPLFPPRVMFADDVMVILTRGPLAVDLIVPAFVNVPPGAMVRVIGSFDCKLVELSMMNVVGADMVGIEFALVVTTAAPLNCNIEVPVEVPSSNVPFGLESTYWLLGAEPLVTKVEVPPLPCMSGELSSKRPLLVSVWDRPLARVIEEDALIFTVPFCPGLRIPMPDNVNALVP